MCMHDAPGNKFLIIFLLEIKDQGICLLRCFSKFSLYYEIGKFEGKKQI